MRKFSTRVAVTVKPKWTQHDIKAQFNAAGTINQVDFVQTAEGKNTGDVVLTYADKEAAQLAIKNYTHTHKARVFNEPQRRVDTLLARRFYLRDLPSEIAKNDVLEFVRVATECKVD